ncbi:Non-specific serine/threonine protein kinase [Bertholletia excelsa]
MFKILNLGHSTFSSPPSSTSKVFGGGMTTITTAIAIDKDKNSQHAVRWAVDNLSGKNSNVILVHVRTQSSQLREDVHKGGYIPTETEMQDLFLPYRGFCARKGIQAKEVVLHDIDIISALVDFIHSTAINVMVVGASNRNALTRAFKHVDVPTSLCKAAPDFCSLYVISKAKIQCSRVASQPAIPASASNSKQTSEARCLAELSQRSNIVASPLNSDCSTTLTPENSLCDLHTQNHAKWSSSHQHSPTNISDCSSTPTFQTCEGSYECADLSYTSDVSRNCKTSGASKDLEADVARLRHKLKQTMEMYNSACKEALLAKKKAKEIDQSKTEETRKLQEAKQAHEEALAQAEIERQKTKAAIEAAEMAQKIAELEAQKRKNAEMKAVHQEKEREKSVDLHEIRYRKYSIEEIELATENFSSSLKIGEGGYGPVYKGLLDHTDVAIKVLGPNMSQGKKQFQQEVEILTYLRHPNMVLLLGACPENGCLVYEYMENGSLEDRLFRRGNTPALPWTTRFKIATEISTSLLFLHQAKPEPLVHRDLKPANILLDQNFVSKIGDVGLARLVPKSVADGITQTQMTATAGTFCYIDPEYQQTGMLDVKSDIYSLGVLLLQIITARPPMALAHNVTRAIEKGTFVEMLDPMITDWPYEDVVSYAKLALRCCELRKRDRPNLGSEVLPELKRLASLCSDNVTNNRGRISSEPSSNTDSLEVRSPRHQKSKQVGA